MRRSLRQPSERVAVHCFDDPDARRWSAALAPLAEVIVAHYLEFLPRLTYPVRSGVHSNTAFGLTFALDYALATDHAELRALIVARALAYYGADQDAPAAWEPGGQTSSRPASSRPT